MVEDNRKRGLGDVVSVDAWHDPFSEHCDRVDLFVDVAFGVGRIGGEDASNVRFRLCLKQAEIVVVIPPNEPAKVDKRSVRRDEPAAPKVRFSETRKSGRSARAGAEASLDISPSGPKTHVKAGAKATVAASRERTLSITKAVQQMCVVHTQTQEGEHKWTVSTTEAVSSLVGRPWDAANSPLLKVVDGRSDRKRGLAPTIRVEIRCRREDLDISDITLKDEPNWSLIRQHQVHRNKELAAEALIRTRLFEQGLLTGDVSDPFAQLTLAVITAEGS